MLLSNLSVLTLPHDIMVRRIASDLIDNGTTGPRKAPESSSRPLRDHRLAEVRDHLKSLGYESKTLRLGREILAEIDRQYAIRLARAEAREVTFGDDNDNDIGENIMMLAREAARDSSHISAARVNAKRAFNVGRSRMRRLNALLQPMIAQDFLVRLGEVGFTDRTAITALHSWSPRFRCGFVYSAMVEDRSGSFLLTNVSNLPPLRCVDKEVEMAFGRLLSIYGTASWQDHNFVVNGDRLTCVEAVALVHQREVYAISEMGVMPYNVTMPTGGGKIVRNLLQRYPRSA